MTPVGWMVTIAVILIVISAASAWRFRSHQPPVPPLPPPTPLPPAARPVVPAVPPILAYATDRPDELLALGLPADLDALGTTIRSLPDQLGRHTEGLLAAIDGMHATPGAVARLVRVDPSMATAIQQIHGPGILTITRGESGSWTHAARPRSLGDEVVNAAALAGALTAMAMQARLGRIEDGIERIARRLDEVAREQQPVADEEREATATRLFHVQSAALSAGEFTSSGWDQVAHLDEQIQAAAAADRRLLDDALDGLERLAGESVGTQTREIEAATSTVLRRYRDYVDSCRSWARFSSLRLWQMTIADDPALPAYTERLEAFIAESGDLRGHGDRVREQFDRMGEFTEYLHPISRRRLPQILETQRSRFAEVDWAPLMVDHDLGDPARRS
ncbi:hypothetical protein [Pseudactinotalea sp. HY158]|uniref:hypothetical protein n=1 Tax=Pseudactinotalea sp. HY158 TaxID=2654547 RepID=UPI00129C8B72|nr:hypothetical protein [Pseudactinotalea sp. HY158]QGH69706.1 hypothetical protein GCE65_09410 [Pseudactinotalea sp. HY158]